MSQLRACPVCGDAIFQGNCTNPDCPNDFGEAGFRRPANRAAIKAATALVLAAHAGDQAARDVLDTATCEATLTSFPRTTKTVIVLRDEGRCVRCGKSIAVCLDDRWHPVEAVHAHHRQAKGMGGRSVDHSAHNGITLCATCHTWVHQHPAESRLKGWIVSWNDSPETVPLIVMTEDGERAYVLDGDTRFSVALSPVDASAEPPAEFWAEQPTGGEVA